MTQFELSLTPPARRLSKSRFNAGLQCHKLLWWKVHEPDAEELQPDKVLQDLFNQGRQVGELAREHFPGGVLIEREDRDPDGRIQDTQAALANETDVIFEGSFRAAQTFVAVDVLVRDGDGYHLIEVKSSTARKDEHIPDAALQRWVVEQNGVHVTRVSIMHLNREHRFPDVNDLFAETDVTEEVNDFLPRVPRVIEEQQKALSGDLPEVPIGAHCEDPRKCPFVKRCWPDDPNHIKKLSGIGFKRADAFFKKGIQWISDLPPTQKINEQQQRQIRAMQENRMVVEPGLAEALEEFDCTLGFLDFETISRAVPVWPEMGPWHHAAAQFSYHEDDGSGGYTHAEHLAEGPEDARPPLVERMLEVTREADRIVVYSSYEKTRIRKQQELLPQYANELKALEDKLLDLYPVMRNYVYHPEFEGSFSLKDVLQPLVPELTYQNLIIVDGRVASVEIARLLFVTGHIPPHEVDQTRQHLLEYCKLDTWATVRLVERLREMV